MSDRPRPKDTKLVPPELLDPVVAYFNPRRVIVFGSVARGEAGPDSDIDLLVIVDDDTLAEKVTLKAGYESRKSYHEPADVIRCGKRSFSAIRGSPERCRGPLLWMGWWSMIDPDPLDHWRRERGAV
jgi:uncharacterized protein